MTSRSEISAWFDEGVTKGAEFMLVLCDTYDWEDYPLYCSNRVEAERNYKHPGSMQKVMEVYNLLQPKEEQLNKARANALV